jgi:hypothetical protein
VSTVRASRSSQQNQNGHAWPTLRLPPQNLEAEQGVLGSVLRDGDRLPDVAQVLRPDDFYRDSHQILYRAILGLYDQGKGIDALILAEELKRRGEFEKVGGDQALFELLDCVPHAANTLYHAQIVREKAVGRRIIELCESTLADAYSLNRTAEELVSLASHRFETLRETLGTSSGGLAALSDADLGIVGADTVEPENVESLWDNRVYIGKLNLMAGEGGDGKSQTVSRVVAATTNPGVAMPDGSKALLNGRCIIVAPEDGAADTVIPRLKAAGADPSKVVILTAKVTAKAKDGTLCVNLMSFQNRDYWEHVIRRVGDVVLIAADPIPACLGRGVNDHRNQEVRMVLEPFVDMLNRLRVALVGVTHLGKSPDVRNPTHKILGSVAYANISRSTHLTSRDPEDPKRRMLFHLKNTYGEERPTLAFRIAEHQVERRDGELVRTSRVEYEADPIEANAVDILEAGRNPGKRRGPSPEKTRKVAEWLFDFLNSRPGAEPFAAIIEAAGALGFVGTQKSDGKWSNPRALYLAKDAVPGLEGERAGYSIDDFKVPIRDGGREILHWRLSRDEGSF